MYPNADISMPLTMWTTTYYIRILDSNNNFHGMGMIAAVAPATKGINRILTDVSMLARVPILFHREEGRGIDAVTYQKLVTMEAQR